MVLVKAILLAAIGLVSPAKEIAKWSHGDSWGISERMEASMESRRPGASHDQISSRPIVHSLPANPGGGPYVIELDIDQLLNTFQGCGQSWTINLNANDVLAVEPGRIHLPRFLIVRPINSCGTCTSIPLKGDNTLAQYLSLLFLHQLWNVDANLYAFRMS